jgi:hypothetical protein
MVVAVAVLDKAHTQAQVAELVVVVRAGVIQVAQVQMAQPTQVVAVAVTQITKTAIRVVLG